MINIEKNQVIDYLEQTIILTLYKKEPNTQFQYDLNNEIIAYYDANSGSGIKFNPDYFDVVKPKPFFLEEASLIDLTELYRFAALKVCDKFGLNLLENPFAKYVAQENDYLLITHKYENNPEGLSTNAPLQLKLIDELHEHSLSLADPFKTAAGGLILFFNVEKKPSMHRSLGTLFTKNKYFNISTENVIFGLGSELSLNSIKTRIKPDLLANINPIHINDLGLNKTQKIKI